jgi:lipopolysaccharide/colanic/teichoic acid biosynthesis glycosyltransferase
MIETLQPASPPTTAGSPPSSGAGPDPGAAGWYERLLKPLLDRSGAALLLLALAPVIGAAAVLIWWRLGKPVLLAQERVGRHGRVFRMYKFRTMLPDRRSNPVNIAFEDRRQVHKSEHDPRHTRLGRLLRAASVDELPQLWNVVRGDMSLVGPRPELVQVVEADSLWDHPRHQVRPGITGIWQLSAARNERLSKNAHLDEAYVRSLSLLTDVRILARTVLVPFRHRGT